MTNQPITSSRPVMLGFRLRSEMERECGRLWRQWRLTVSHSNRQEIAQKINAIQLLLGHDNEKLIGRDRP